LNHDHATWNYVRVVRMLVASKYVHEGVSLAAA